MSGERERLHVPRSRMQYNDGYNEIIVSFANNIHTPEGGMHETGFKAALTRVLNDYGKKTGILKEGDEHLRRGLPRGPHRGHLRQADEPPVRGPDEGQARQLRDAHAGRQRRVTTSCRSFWRRTPPSAGRSLTRH